MNIRPAKTSDLTPLLAMLKQSGQFDTDGVNYVRETLNAHLAADSEAIWYCAEDGGFAGVIYCAPDIMADDVWNLLMMWVESAYQRRGVGSALMAKLMEILPSRHARLLLVETSGLDDFTAARAFYHHLGFVEEARIRDYYAPGEDKLIYTRHLRG